MTVTLRRLTIAAFVVAAVLYTWPAVAQKQDDAADTARLVEALAIREGATVADIGAGPEGLLTVPIARHVGPGGRVYASDVSEKTLAALRGIAAKAEHKNIEVVEGASEHTNLGDECCDAIFMRHVYHHFANPAAMNASLRRALKPGGLLAVVDFAPRARRNAPSATSAPPGERSSSESHGVTPQTVIEELKAAGFVDVAELSWTSKSGFFVRARRSQ
jgi:ubiquinone/menaquinone biosynthesis C-methylase UbiE